MAQNSSTNRLIDPVILGSWIAQRSHIWQMDFLTAKELADFVHKRGLSWYHEEHINLLWRLGLLKADLIVSSQEVDEPGLTLVGQERLDDEENGFDYADARLPKLIQDSPETSFEEMQLVPSTLKIYFHPFRFTVLHNFERLDPHFEPPRILYPQMYRTSESMKLWLQWTTPTQEYLQSTQQWNDVASLLVATEPCFYQRIFQHLHVRLLQTRPLPRRYSQENDSETVMNASFNELREEIDRHWNEVANLYRSLDLNRLKQLHYDLCHQAQILDSNTAIHTILRLGNERLRLDLEGHLGGAMLITTMAEFLRRATEEVFAVQLQEEDLWRDDAKEKLFGYKRLIDGDRNADNEFLRQRGLNYGPSLRWYVEGDTEFSGLSDFFRSIGATDMEILNLKGQVVQKNSIAFRESLRSDIRMGIFSFVSLDADVSRNLQVLRAAAQKNQICGSFFVSSPDFEIANFDLSELQEIVWKIALERGAEETKKSLFLSVTSSLNSGREFEQKIKQASSEIPGLWNISKGEVWGKQLMQYALSHPERPNGETRHIIKSIRLAFNTRTANYNYTRIHFRVDPETGESVKRDTPMTNKERSKEI
jgi:hypothetical protein